jgi:hypothetical protein
MRTKRQNQTYINRLLKVADLLEDIKPEKFFFGFFFSDSNRCAKLDAEQKPLLNDCGTNACALGYASAIPSLRRAGLKMVYMNMAWKVDGIEKVFGLSTHEVEYLFFPIEDDPDQTLVYGKQLSRNATPKEVAEHIRNFVRDHMKD